MKILLAGESWMSHTTHVKGFDSFTTSSYHEAAGPMIEAFRAHGHEVTYLPNHVAPTAFPDTVEALEPYDVVILSDIGANTLLLPDSTFVQSKRGANRLDRIAAYVQQGGGLLMVGGYLTFQGIEGKGQYRGTAVGDLLPVQLEATDDRVELPQGAVPEVVAGDHPILAGLTDWPHFLGYNRSALRSEATLVASIEGDPFIAVVERGRGRAGVFASDCGPHWGPPEFLAWDGYATLWNNLVTHLARQDR
jgi:uncharacterized membrane protein